MAPHMNFFTADAFAQVERLEKTGWPREQAVAIVQSQHELFEHAVVNTLATKSYVFALRLEMSDMKSDIIKWVAGMLVVQAAAVSTLVKLL
jgi:hypothetical protein